MSVRALGTRLLRHGSACVRIICRRHYNATTIADKLNAVPHTATQQASNSRTQLVPRSFTLRSVGAQVGVHARKIFIDNVLNRVTNSLAAEMRKKAAKRLMFGDSGAFFAFVGVSLASGTGILTKEEELEGVCWEIRTAVSKLKWNYVELDVNRKQVENEAVTLKDLDLGKVIAKGANAVVYAAKVEDVKEVNDDGRFDVVKCKKMAVEDSVVSYPLAVKMMFNYDIQSNALTILKAMYRETLPARMWTEELDRELNFSTQRKHLPPHPNIVAMFSAFADYVPELEDAKELYPAALPQRLHPDGEGRNMSLFMVMKRYDSSLNDYLKRHHPIPVRTSILLLTHLLEGVCHLTTHGVAHRDLKSDNLLVDLSEPEAPILLITDFGCCLADRKHGLQLPYTSEDVDRGGNMALMAPEIINQGAGTFSVLNYGKSDLWAAGTIAYEMFGCENPFYKAQKLWNREYADEELPELPENVPPVVRALVRHVLRRNPSKRLDPEVAANVCQLFLWAPSAWLKGVKLPSSPEILEWLLCMTTKVLCEARLSCGRGAERSGDVYKTGRRTYPEYLLISSFLSRAKLAMIRNALVWIHENV